MGTESLPLRNGHELEPDMAAERAKAMEQLDRVADAAAALAREAQSVTAVGALTQIAEIDARLRDAAVRLAQGRGSECLNDIAAERDPVRRNRMLDALLDVLPHLDA